MPFAFAAVTTGVETVIDDDDDDAAASTREMASDILQTAWSAARGRVGPIMNCGLTTDDDTDDDDVYARMGLVLMNLSVTSMHA